MNSIDTFMKRLREQITSLGREIEVHNQQVEALSKRLDGLRRADELFESDQAAVAELLQASVANGNVMVGSRATAPAAKAQIAAGRNATRSRKQSGRTSARGLGNMKPGPAPSLARGRGQGGGLTQVDMIAAVLRRHPRRTVRELITLLEKEFRWKAKESAVTGKLYTRRDKFVHTQPDRSINRPVTWSLK